MLCNLAVDLGLEQMVTFSSHSRGNILDLVLTNSPHNIKLISPLFSPLLTSDLFPISFYLITKSCSNCHRDSDYWFYDYKHTDYESLNFFLLEVDFSPIYNTTDVNFIWTFVKDNVLCAINMFTPIVITRSSERFPLWLSGDTSHQLNKVCFLCKYVRQRLLNYECTLQI